MKKQLRFLLFLVVAFIALIWIGPSTKHPKDTITIGASNIPHAEILQHVAPQLKKEYGLNLNIKVFQDYVMPNRALQGKELDANYFQTPAFLEQWNRNNDGDIVNRGAVHLEPIGIYSKKVSSLKDLKNNATVLASSNAPDNGRVLQMFQEAGLITLKKGTDITQANFNDIDKNPRHLNFKHSYEPKLLPEIYKNNEGDAVVINSNYAVQSGLNPLKDSIALQRASGDSPYNNIVATRKKSQNSKEVNGDVDKLVKILQSKSTQDWIKDKYKGSVLPVTK